VIDSRAARAATEQAVADARRRFRYRLDVRRAALDAAVASVAGGRAEVLTEQQRESEVLAVLGRADVFVDWLTAGEQ
jgi:hypothetical protein